MIRHVLFDLDCTLYSAVYGLEENVVRRMKEYLAKLFGSGAGEAWAERNKNINNFGTTLEWLVADKGFTAINEYMEYIHPEDEADSLPPDPALRGFIEGLPCPSSVLTNSPLFHAERIIKKMGLNGLFKNLFTVDGNGHKGKPHASAYIRALNKINLKAEEVLFVDDLPRYVEGFTALGGMGVLFDEMDKYKDSPHIRIKSIFELSKFINQTDARSAGR